MVYCQQRYDGGSSRKWDWWRPWVQNEVHAVHTRTLRRRFGPVYTEGEVIYRYGKKYAYEDTAFFNTTATQGVGDVTYNGWSGYAMANVDIKPAYVGGCIGLCRG